MRARVGKSDREWGKVVGDNKFLVPCWMRKPGGRTRTRGGMVLPRMRSIPRGA